MINVTKISKAEQTAQSSFKTANAEISVPRIRDLALLAEILKSQGMGDPKKLGDKNATGKPELTLADLLSTESIPRSDLELFINKLLKWLLKKDFGNPKIEIKKINEIYQAALQQVRYLGFPISAERFEFRFKSKQIFIDALDSIKPMKGVKPHDILMNCVIARVMDSVADVELCSRIETLDQEAEQVSRKLQSIPGLSVSPIGDEGKYIIVYNPPDGSDRFFKGVLHMRKKHLRNILLKLQYNRRYNTPEVLKDLLWLRFEANEKDKKTSDKYLRNAVDFFSKHFFNPETVELDQKWWLLSKEFLESCSSEITVASGAYDGGWNKTATSKGLQNADLTGEIPIKKTSRSRDYDSQTGKIEMQFQRVDGMTNFNSPEIYDLKKFISAAARNLPGISIDHLKFFIHLVGLDSGISEDEIVHHLFSQQSYSEEDEKYEESDSRKKRERQIKSAFPNHWFLLPMETPTGKIRLSTTDIWSPEISELYEHYPSPMRTPITLERFKEAYKKTDIAPMLNWAKYEHEKLLASERKKKA